MTIVEDDIFNHVGEQEITLVGTNLYASMANGFQLDVALNYPYVYEANMATRYGDIKKLGTILECKEEGNPTFVLCFVTKGYNFRPDLEKDYLSYDALANALRLVSAIYGDKSIASPIIGLSRFEGNGNKDEILSVYEKYLGDKNVVLYDFQDRSRAEKMKLMREAELKLKEADREAYYEAVRKRKMLAEERFKKNGRRRY